MAITKGMMSSNTDNWATPQHVFDRMNRQFGFDLDVCADDENHKCDRYYTREDDGLEQAWSGRVWCNPPYGREIAKWVKKCAEYENIAVMLVPARTDTKWWQDFVMPNATDVLLVRGRLRFGGAKAGAPFPSAIVVFDPIYKMIKDIGTPRFTTIAFD